MKAIKAVASNDAACSNKSSKRQTNVRVSDAHVHQDVQITNTSRQHLLSNSFTSTTIDTKLETIRTQRLVTKVGRFVLTKATSVGTLFSLGRRAVAVVIDNPAFYLRPNRHTGTTIKAMVITTLITLYLAIETKEAIRTNAMHKVITGILPKALITKLCHLVIFDSQLALSSILAFHGTFWNLSFIIFTMLSIMVWSTATWSMRLILPLFLAVSSIDTKDVIIVVPTRDWHWNFTILSDMLNTKFIDGISTITKVLDISKAICDTWNTRAAIVALVLWIAASNIRSSTL